MIVNHKNSEITESMPIANRTQGKLKDILNDLDNRINNISSYVYIIESDLQNLYKTDINPIKNEPTVPIEDIVGNLLERLQMLYTIENRLYELKEKTNTLLM